MASIWTYTVIDWDLLRDDLESADGILPGLFWLTQDKARLALVEDLRERWRDSMAEDGEDFEPPVLRLLDNGDLFCDDWNGLQLSVYEMKAA